MLQLKGSGKYHVAVSIKGLSVLSYFNAQHFCNRTAMFNMDLVHADYYISLYATCALMELLFF